MISEDVIKKAKTIYDRRLQIFKDRSPSYRRTLAEMYFLDKYAGRDYLLDDSLQHPDRGMIFRPCSDDGKYMELVGHHYEDKFFQVYSSQLENDLIVFWEYDKRYDNDFVFSGYLPTEYIKGCEARPVLHEGRRVMHFFKVHPTSLFPMPEDFCFPLIRQHSCTPNLAYNEEIRAWQCQTCKVSFPGVGL